MSTKYSDEVRDEMDVLIELVSQMQEEIEQGE